MELMVRVAHDNGLLLDLESVTVNGHRYAVRTEPNVVESKRDEGAVAEILTSDQVVAGLLTFHAIP